MTSLRASRASFPLLSCLTLALACGACGGSDEDASPPDTTANQAGSSSGGAAQAGAGGLAGATQAGASGKTSQGGSTAQGGAAGAPQAGAGQSQGGAGQAQGGAGQSQGGAGQSQGGAGNGQSGGQAQGGAGSGQSGAGQSQGGAGGEQGGAGSEQGGAGQAQGGAGSEQGGAGQGGAGQGGAAGGAPFMTYDRTQIEVTSTKTQVIDGASYTQTFYTNKAYRCGRTGYFTFLTLEPTALAGQAAPLWVDMHGGGVGYYDTDGHYHPGGLKNGQWVAPNESNNDEESVTQLLDSATKRLRKGARMLSLSMCDHALYAGLGTSYPNDPVKPDPGVNSLLASAAAIHYAARGRGVAADAFQGYPLTAAFMHGSSAGSAGAYHVSSALARNGVKLSGAVLDSYIVTSRHGTIFEAQCGPVAQDPTFSQAEVEAKLGTFSGFDYLLENNLGGDLAIPYLFLDGVHDAECCSDPAKKKGYVLVDAAKQAGFATTCEWIYDGLHGALAARGSDLWQFHQLPTGKHVVATLENPNDPDEVQAYNEAQAFIASWVASVEAAGVQPPAFAP